MLAVLALVFSRKVRVTSKVIEHCQIQLRWLAHLCFSLFEIEVTCLIQGIVVSDIILNFVNGPRKMMSVYPI